MALRPHPEKIRDTPLAGYRQALSWTMYGHQLHVIPHQICLYCTGYGQVQGDSVAFIGVHLYGIANGRYAMHGESVAFPFQSNATSVTLTTLACIGFSTLHGLIKSRSQPNCARWAGRYTAARCRRSPVRSRRSIPGAVVRRDPGYTAGWCCWSFRRRVRHRRSKHRAGIDRIDGIYLYSYGVLRRLLSMTGQSVNPGNRSITARSGASLPPHTPVLHCAADSTCAADHQHGRV
jgi:hypothetical protein